MAGHLEKKLFDLVKKNGGRFVLLGEVFGAEEFIRLDCAEGHTTIPRISAILAGAWCSKCHKAEVAMAAAEARAAAAMEIRVVAEQVTRAPFSPPL